MDMTKLTDWEKEVVAELKKYGETDETIPALWKRNRTALEMGKINHGKPKHVAMAMLEVFY